MDHSLLAQYIRRPSAHTNRMMPSGIKARTSRKTRAPLAGEIEKNSYGESDEKADADGAEVLFGLAKLPANSRHHL
jgi:hypothetical protein